MDPTREGVRTRQLVARTESKLLVGQATARLAAAGVSTLEIWANRFE